MKNVLITIVCFLTLSSMGFSQSNASQTEKLKAQIIASEKAGWEAWKNKDAEWFKINTTKDFLNVSRDGISNKEQVIKSTSTDCDVKSVSLDEFTFVELNEKTMVLTYIAYQNGVCGDSMLAAKVRVTATYIKQGRKWLEAFYMEAVIEEAKPFLDLELSDEENQH